MAPEPNSGLVAIVTAAGKGIGAGIARRLAADGYCLGLLSNSGGAADLAGQLGPEVAIAHTGSVTDANVLGELVDSTMSTFGRVDAVVNNTGHPPKGDLLSISDADWHLGMDLLLLNVVRMARLVTPIMERQRGGSIVNISTYAAFEPDLAFPVSSSLRAALGDFAKLYADRYASSGIRMNNVLPGFTESYPENPENVARIPMGRYGLIDEIAAAVAFLVSDESGYVTGQNLRVDGGLSRSV
ncbi:MAG TPA: SDR family oxidoreductase [Acidimicrobiia bacterium]|nr:SDR family oxidoreductase [Acidimicrobiia bacterium]